MKLEHRLRMAAAHGLVCAASICALTSSKIGVSECTLALRSSIAGVSECTVEMSPSIGGVTEKDFEEQLGVVERTIAASKWSEAKTLLMAALEKHKDQPWVLYHLSEITDDLERCAFWSGTAKPNPKDLISGNLVSYSAVSGQIDLRYAGSADAAGETGKSPAKGKNGKRPTLSRAFKDFSDASAMHVHPLAFEGPFKISMHGESYPSLGDMPDPPAILVCSEWDQAYFVSFGFAEEHVNNKVQWVPARIMHVQNGEVKTVSEAMLPSSSVLPYQLEVVVTPSNIIASFNGTKLLSCTKPATLFGRFGFEHCPELKDVQITGKVQPSWLQGVVDSTLQEKKAAFESHYRAHDELPDWLKEKVKAAPRAPVSFRDSYPGGEHPKAKEQLTRVDELLEKKDSGVALTYVSSIAESDATPALRAWLMTVIDLALGNPTQALEDCRKVTALDPRYFRAREMQIKLESDSDSTHETIEKCRALTKEFASEPQAYSDLATLLLIDDHLDEARSTLRSAIDAGIAHEDLEKADHLLSRAVKGPPWTRSYEYKSEHYDVTSDISQSLCSQAATLLEKFYIKYDVHLHHVPMGPKRAFRVFLFSGQAGYQAYSKDLLGREHKNTAGLYSPLVKQLLIWNLPDVQDMLRTVRHEGFHQYLDRLVTDAPRWMNEGMAEYFEVSKIVNGNWSDGEMQPAHTALLHKATLVPLKKLMHLDAAGFYAEKTVALNYAESWAFVHFLLNSGLDHKKRFDKFLDALFAGTKPSAATATVFDDASLPTLQGEFEDYVRALK